MRGCLEISSPSGRPVQKLKCVGSQMKMKRSRQKRERAGNQGESTGACGVGTVVFGAEEPLRTPPQGERVSTLSRPWKVQQSFHSCYSSTLFSSTNCTFSLSQHALLFLTCVLIPPVCCSFWTQSLQKTVVALHLFRLSGTLPVLLGLVQDEAVGVSVAGVLLPWFRDALT